MTPQKVTLPLPDPTVTFLVPPLLLMLLSIFSLCQEEVVLHAHAVHTHAAHTYAAWPPSLTIKLNSSTLSQPQGDIDEGVSCARSH